MFILLPSKSFLRQLGVAVAAWSLWAISFASSGLSIDKIRAAAYMGSGEPVEISPEKETERWSYGESDPSQIWLSTKIVPAESGNIEVSVFFNVKVGELSFAESKGIDKKKIADTARWTGEKLLKRDVISAKSGEAVRYQYKFLFDDLIQKTFEKNQWPYVLSFRVVAKQHNKEVKSKKYIVLTPDNKFGY